MRTIDGRHAAAPQLRFDPVSSDFIREHGPSISKSPYPPGEQTMQKPVKKEVPLWAGPSYTASPVRTGLALLPFRVAYPVSPPPCTCFSQTWQPPWAPRHRVRA